ncbi:MAG: nucleotidyltransferase domain-containing protein [Vicinamibacterales bacterium]
MVGSLANQPGDRWSDLDLTFAVGEEAGILEVLDDWSERLVEEFEAVRLFDLPSGGAIYRVFVLRGCLQFDLSFSPAAQFGAIGPEFRLLFGTATEKPFIGRPSASELFGYAVHHAVRAHVCIERQRYWQAEYWISSLRDNAMSLACRRLGLPAYYGRGFDELPENVRRAFADALVRSLDRAELLRALHHAVAALLRERDEAGDLPASIEPRLREFIGLPATDGMSRRPSSTPPPRGD